MINLSRICAIVIFILSVGLKILFIVDIIQNYVKNKRKLSEPIMDFFQPENNWHFDFTYFEISSDLQKIENYSLEILDLCKITSIQSGKQLLLALKNQLTNYMSVKELEYDLINKKDFIVYTFDNRTFLINCYEKNNKKLCFLHNVSSYIKLKNSENLINSFFYKVLPTLSQYVEVHNNDNVYTSNSCGPINIKNAHNLKLHNLSDQCVVYVSESFSPAEIINEFAKEIPEKIYNTIINKFNMKRIYRNQEFFNLSNILNSLYMHYNINVYISNIYEIHGNKQSLTCLLEFFFLRDEIPTLEKTNVLHIKVASKINKNEQTKKDVINLLTYHAYDFSIESTTNDIIYIYFQCVHDLHMVNDLSLNTTKLLTNDK